MSFSRFIAVSVAVLFLLTPAVYEVRVSFIGYETQRDTIALVGGQVLERNTTLSPGGGELAEVLVEGERSAGVSRITAGLQTIRAEELERVPSPDLSGDLASYLTTLPGVITSGDRGGQLFIRGGEPAHNLVLLDGMTIYQPFHILGFYSAFSADILQRADGQVRGADFRVEIDRPAWSAYVTYGLSSVTYDAQQEELALWFGDASIAFRPPHDRRHQINPILGRGPG